MTFELIKLNVDDLSNVDLLDILNIESVNILICENCDKKFIPHRKGMRFCKKKCSRIFWNKINPEKRKIALKKWRVKHPKPPSLKMQLAQAQQALEEFKKRYPTKEKD